LPHTHGKLVSEPYLRAWRDTLGKTGVVATNGCFDILHVGHISVLEEARRQGEHLVVGVNSDAAVKALKGDGRPINSEYDRARVIAALEVVDYVYIFDDVRATEFLKLVRPHVWVKGGDYTVEMLNPGEREAVISAGGVIYLAHTVEGKSTTSILNKANERAT
jgi:glycerol-3-phosphate cytidylyltransferase